MTGMLLERRHWHPLVWESTPGGLSQHGCGDMAGVTQHRADPFLQEPLHTRALLGALVPPGLTPSL